VAVKASANNQKFRGTYKFVADELLRDPLARQTVEARLKGETEKADYSGSKGTLALAMTNVELARRYRKPGTAGAPTDQCAAALAVRFSEYDASMARRKVAKIDGQ